MAIEPSPPLAVASRLLAGCDPAQRAAITTDAAPLCVLAPAGSGKTRVLTRRIAWRVHAGSASGRYVLALTFTRKAAAELRGRLAALALPEAVTAGTFHAVALSELRRLALERHEAPPVVAASKARLIAAGAGGRADRSLLASVALEIEWAKARCLVPSAYEDAVARAGRRPAVAASTVAELFERYEREKRRRGVVDFDDLLLACGSELRDDPDFAASARWRFRHLFVDEYQDVNAAQLRLLDAWLGERDDLCVVGDPDQAIYAWNGSDPEAIADFPRRHPGASVLRLETNYRSSPEVLAVASSLLAPPTRPASPGASPTPGERAARPSGRRPSVTAFASDEDEAAAVVEAIRNGRRQGRRWSSYAVLARTNAQLARFERSFAEASVPCRSGGGRAFLSRPGVRDALASLRGRPGRDAVRIWLTDLESSLRAERPPLGEGAADEALREREPLVPGAGPAFVVPRSPARTGDVAELAQLTADYLADEAVPSADGLVAWLEASLRSDPPHAAGDAVELLSFHRAKGLEWPVVFVTGLEAGLVPIAHAERPEELDEERRLLYVACTRAEEELHCTWAASRSFGGRPVRREPSPYLAALEATGRELARVEALAPERARTTREHVRALLAARAARDDAG